jgi:hypothetical protein
MTRETESALVVYRAELEQVTTNLDESLIERIKERGVQWSCVDVEPQDFDRRIYQGVGYYTLINNVVASLPQTVSCNAAPDQQQQTDKLRRTAEVKRDALFADLPELIADMNTDGPILEVVNGFTGQPPSWGNVLRIAAATRW